MEVILRKIKSFFKKYQKIMISILAIILFFAIYVALFRVTKNNILILIYYYSMWIILVNVSNIYYLSNNKFIFYSLLFGQTRKSIFRNILLECFYNLLLILGGIAIYTIFAYLNTQLFIFNIISYLIVANILAMYILTTFLGLLFGRIGKHSIILFIICVALIAMMLLSIHYLKLSLILILSVLMIISFILGVIFFYKGVTRLFVKSLD